MTMLKYLFPVKQPLTKCVVRIRTSSFETKSGIRIVKDLTYLSRLSSGINLLGEECNAVGASDAIKRIINIDACDDGLYQLIPCNLSCDWESGNVEDYDLKLIQEMDK
jgi:hypothetical protein